MKTYKEYINESRVIFDTIQKEIEKLIAETPDSDSVHGIFNVRYQAFGGFEYFVKKEKLDWWLFDDEFEGVISNSVRELYGLSSKEADMLYDIGTGDSEVSYEMLDNKKFIKALSTYKKNIELAKKGKKTKNKTVKELAKFLESILTSKSKINFNDYGN